ncbi:hypothetical protein QE432_002181 [Agrobacterium sp. SORGH_AS 745]|nr:hypothetical protein [Agrobacterium tumefaciens]MDQ1220600.1 hypothetical protein [Agrobacterium sp. SORGH_AS_0745]
MKPPPRCRILENFLISLGYSISVVADDAFLAPRTPERIHRKILAGSNLEESSRNSNPSTQAKADFTCSRAIASADGSKRALEGFERGLARDGAAQWKPRPATGFNTPSAATYSYSHHHIRLHHGSVPPLGRGCICSWFVRFVKGRPVLMMPVHWRPSSSGIASPRVIQRGDNP